MTDSFDGGQEAAQLDAAIVALQRGEGRFSELAARLFEYQYRRNRPYRRLCRSRGVDPASIRDWRDVPAVPIAAFKELDLACAPTGSAVVCLRSSGTTRGRGRRSRHWIFDLGPYRHGVSRSFPVHLVPEGGRLPVVHLLPDLAAEPDSSLAYMGECVMRDHADDASGRFLRHGRIDFRSLERYLGRLEGGAHPVLLLGTSAVWAECIERWERSGTRFALPAGSRIMDTGGFKRRRRTVAFPDLVAGLGEHLGVAAAGVVREYGMCELTSQFYDGVAGQEAPRLFRPPSWVRTRVVDPATGDELPRGEVGLLRHCDLANRGSVTTIETEDLGVAAADGFRLVGRLPGSPPRGCSLRHVEGGLAEAGS